MSGYDAIPVELRERKQWVLWRTERRDGKYAGVDFAHCTCNERHLGRFATSTPLAVMMFPPQQEQDALRNNVPEVRHVEDGYGTGRASTLARLYREQPEASS